MRIVFVGAGQVSVETAKDLIQHGHEIIMIDPNQARINELYEHLDCGFILGDGANPEILMEANPEYTDILFCLTDNDQVNILSSLIAGTLGFQHIVTSVADPQYEEISIALGLKNVIMPVRAISRHLQNLVAGKDEALSKLT